MQPHPAPPAAGDADEARRRRDHLAAVWRAAHAGSASGAGAWVRLRLARAVAAYLRSTPVRRGTGLLGRRVFDPLLPEPPASYVAPLHWGGRLRVLYREALGTGLLIQGAVEPGELEVLRAALRPGDTVVDVGANVGLFTIPLAQAVGAGGRVLAFEPEEENVRRLRENVELNGLANVEVVRTAVGSRDGEATLALGDDAVFHSVEDEGATPEVTRFHRTGRRVTVPLARLDTEWARRDRFPVAALKIDVEGAEADVLRGAGELLRTCRPLVLLEAHGAQVEQVERLLRELGYARRQAPGLEPYNHLFEPASG